MVHALSEARRVLQPGGVMIDLRPTARNRQVELELAEGPTHVGEIDSSQSAAEKRMADEMLQAAIDEGVFHAEHCEPFEYITDLDTLEDLQEFAAGLRRSVMPDSIFERIKALIADDVDDYLIRIRREMLVARYRRL